MRKDKPVTFAYAFPAWAEGMSNRLASCRAARGETFRQVAEAVGTSAASVHRIEHGNYKTNICALSLIVALAEHFQVSLEWLVQGKGGEKTDRQSIDTTVRSTMTALTLADLAKLLAGKSGGKWKAVPVEATDKMLTIGDMTLTMPWADVTPPGTDPDLYVMAATYRATVDAAPELEEE